MKRRRKKKKERDREGKKRIGATDRLGLSIALSRLSSFFQLMESGNKFNSIYIYVYMYMNYLSIYLSIN